MTALTIILWAALAVILASAYVWLGLWAMHTDEHAVAAREAETLVAETELALQGASAS